MSRKNHKRSHLEHPLDGDETLLVGRPVEPDIAHEDYKSELHSLQVEFVKLQRHFIKRDERILCWRPEE